MSITVIADRSVLTAAFAAAEQVGAPGKLTGLHAPLDGATLGRLDEAWDEIKDMLEAAFDHGSDTARSLFEKALHAVNEIIRSAGDKANTVRDYVLERLRSYANEFVDGVLKQVRTEIVAGNTKMRLSEIHVTQRVMLGSSLSMSLTEAFELTSNGEFQIVTNYIV